MSEGIAKCSDDIETDNLKITSIVDSSSDVDVEYTTTLVWEYTSYSSTDSLFNAVAGNMTSAVANGDLGSEAQSCAHCGALTLAADKRTHTCTHIRTNLQNTLLNTCSRTFVGELLSNIKKSSRPGRYVHMRYVSSAFISSLNSRCETKSPNPSSVLRKSSVDINSYVAPSDFETATVITGNKPTPGPNLEDDSGSVDSTSVGIISACTNKHKQKALVAQLGT